MKYKKGDLVEITGGMGKGRHGVVTFVDDPLDALPYRVFVIDEGE